MKLLVWLIVIGLIVLVIKRIGAGLVGVAMFVGAIFFSIFMLDTFTVFNVRDYVDVGFYDETRKNPQGAVEKVKDAVNAGGQVAINKINDIGEKAQNRYDTSSIVNKGTEEEPSTEAVPEHKPLAKPETEEKKPKKESKEVLTLEGYQFIPLREYARTASQYKESMTARDYAIFKSLTPLLSITYEGDNYIFRTERGTQGVYIQLKEA